MRVVNLTKENEKCNGKLKEQIDVVNSLSMEKEKMKKKFQDPQMDPGKVEEESKTRSFRHLHKKNIAAGKK